MKTCNFFKGSIFQVKFSNMIQDSSTTQTIEFSLAKYIITYVLKHRLLSSAS